MILVTENLRKYFGEVRAVDGVSLAIEKETLTSIIGPNGAGKTTLINLISGRLKADSGKVTFLGKDITFLTPHKIVRIGIVRSFQLVDIYNGLSVFDNVRVAVLSNMGKTRDIFSFLERDAEVIRRVDDILKTFGLHESKDALARDLPHGERKLLDVAMSFSLDPKLILLDEPTSGVSAGEKGRVMDVIESVVRQRGITAIIVEHDMDVVFSYSDRIVAMHQGRILADGPPEKIKENEDVRKVIMGEE